MMEALVEDSNGGLACVSPTAPLKQAGDTVWIVPNQKAKQALALRRRYPGTNDLIVDLLVQGSVMVEFLRGSQ